MSVEVFEKQGFLDIILDTNIDLTAATTLQIDYTKPDGTVAFWAGTIEATTKIKKTLVNADIDQIGVWLFQAFVVISGRNAYGKIVKKEFKETLI